MLPAETAGEALIVILNGDSTQNIEIGSGCIVSTRDGLGLNGGDSRFGLRLNGQQLATGKQRKNTTGPNPQNNFPRPDSAPVCRKFRNKTDGNQLSDYQRVSY